MRNFSSCDNETLFYFDGKEKAGQITENRRNNVKNKKVHY